MVMKVIWAVLAIVCAATMAGCGNSGGDTTPTPSNAEKDFQTLYRQYSAKFYKQVTPQEAEVRKPEELAVEAAKIWDSVFAAHKDLLATRAAEILKELDKATPLKEDLYVEVAALTRDATATESSDVVIPKQFLWNPVSAAQIGLNNWLFRLDPKAYTARSVMNSIAGLSWETVDPNIDRPILQQRQGSLIFLVELTRKDDYYQVAKLRWLKPKAMGETPAATGTGGALPLVTATAGTVPPVTSTAKPTGTSAVPVPSTNKTNSSGPKG
jgi:hypothetical protein